MTNIAAMDKDSLWFYRTGLGGWIGRIQDENPPTASPNDILAAQLDDTVQLCDQVLRVHALVEKLERDATSAHMPLGFVAIAFAKEIRKALGGLD